MYCPKCGTENQDNNYQCTQCGGILHATTAQQVVVTSDETLGGMIPMKNGAAVAAYYLGVFSLIPFIGIPLGIAAFILGIKGLRKAKEHPEVKGKAHAWVGIIAGGLFTLLYLGLIVVAMVSRSS
jgi:zinc ribbon protein